MHLLMNACQVDEIIDRLNLSKYPQYKFQLVSTTYHARKLVHILY